MPLVVCLNSNIYDESEQKRVRGESWEASQSFVDAIAWPPKEGGFQRCLRSIGSKTTS